MSPDERINRGIDRVLDSARSRLSAWELDFLNGMRDQYRKKGKFSPRQKDIARPILKRYNALED